MKKLLWLLEFKWASAICVLFAIANRVIFATLFSEIGRDARVQITVAKNLLAGKGFGVIKYFSTDLNSPVFDKHQLFPPGFSFTIIPFLELFGNEYKAVLAFDILMAIAFVFAVRILGKTAGLSAALNNILTIISGCFQYSFIMSGTSSDVAGLTFLLAGLTIVIKIILSTGPRKPISLVFYAFVFFLPSFFRFMYLPVSVLFPLIILGVGLYQKNNSLKKTGGWLGLLTVLFISLMLFVTNLYSGSSVHVIDTGRGVFFDQLIHWFPYIPASFINPDFLAQLITRVTGFDYLGVFKAFEIINVLLLCCILFLLFWVRPSFKKLLLKQSAVFIMAGTFVAISILLLLTYFSLTYKPQLYGVYMWNYNYESRYFAFIYIFFPIAFLILVSSNVVRSRMVRAVLICFSFLLLTEVVHGVYFNIKILTNQRDTRALKDRVADYRQFPALLDSLKAKYADRELLISASDQFFLYSASEKGYKAIFDYTNLNTIDISVNKKSILLFPVHETDLWLMEKYLERKKPVMLNKVAGTVFFIEEINPQ